MGWSQSSMVNRYQHVPSQLREEIARQQGGLFWEQPEGRRREGTDSDDGQERDRKS